MFDNSSKLLENSTKVKKTVLPSRVGKRNILQALQPSSLCNDILVGSGGLVTLDQKQQKWVASEELYVKCGSSETKCSAVCAMTEDGTLSKDTSSKNEKLPQCKLQRHIPHLSKNFQTQKVSEGKHFGASLKNSVKTSGKGLQGKIEAKRKIESVNDDHRSDTKKSKLSPLNTEISCAAQSSAHLVVGNDVPPEYWKELAEQRRLALEEALKENEMLHDQLEVLEVENAQLREMTGETQYLASILQNLVGE